MFCMIGYYHTNCYNIKRQNKFQYYMIQCDATHYTIIPYKATQNYLTQNPTTLLWHNMKNNNINRHSVEHLITRQYHNCPHKHRGLPHRSCVRGCWKSCILHAAKTYMSLNVKLERKKKRFENFEIYCTKH